MSEFHFNVDQQETLTYGSATAPHKLVAVLNLGCTASQKWWLANQANLLKAADQGQLVLHLKFWNKKKTALTNGNIAQEFIDYNDPETALRYVDAVFNNQAILRSYDCEDVPAYLEKRFGVRPYAHAEQVKHRVAQQTFQNEIATVPTLIYDDQKFTGDQWAEREAVLN